MTFLERIEITRIVKEILSNTCIGSNYCLLFILFTICTFSFILKLYYKRINFHYLSITWFMILSFINF